LKISARYTHIEEPILQAIANDFAAEDLQLAEAIEKGRLDLWWPGIIEAAKTRLRETKDGEGARQANVEAEKRAIERKLRAQTPNGINGVHSHSHSYDQSQDQEGDIFME
jgi:hypothetical protein